jgi:hypothetical protein
MCAARGLKQSNVLVMIGGSMITALTDMSQIESVDRGRDLQSKPARADMDESDDQGRQGSRYRTSQALTAEQNEPQTRQPGLQVAAQLSPAPNLDGAGVAHVDAAQAIRFDNQATLRSKGNP